VKAFLVAKNIGKFELGLEKRFTFCLSKRFSDIFARRFYGQETFPFLLTGSSLSTFIATSS
jgi:hypothetical protein